MSYQDRRWLQGVVTGFLLFGGACSVFAQPNVGEFSPRGLEAGGVTRLVFKGAGFDAETRLLAKFPIAEQTLVGDATGQRLELEIRLDAQVTSGIHQVWLAGKSGLSKPMVLAIDHAPQLAASQSIQQLPVAVHGTLRGNQVQVIPFPVTAGQTLTVDVQARRLGGALQPLVRVFDEEGRQVASGHGRGNLEGDVQFRFVAPKTETLSLEIQDLLLRGAMPGHYKVCIGEFEVLGQPWPFGISLREAGQAKVSFPEAASSGAAKIQEIMTFPGWFSLHAKSQGRLLSGQAKVLVSRANETMESEFSTDEVLETPLPLGINAVLSKPEERDKFRIQVKPGSVLKVDVWSDRLGVDSDGMVVVRVPGGKELGRNDDAAGSKDPQLQVTVPNDQEVIEVEFWDMLGQGSSTHRYRIEITDTKSPQVEMKLGMTGVKVSPDGGALLVVPINRKGFSGPLDLSLSPEVPGIQVSGGHVPANSNRGLLFLTVAPDARPAVTQFVAQTHQDGLGMVSASREKNNLSGTFPWFDRELAVAPVPAVGYQSEVVGLEEATTLWQGGVARFKTNLIREDGLSYPVRLQLMTTQQMPRKKIKKDNKDQEVDDVDRALRLEQSVVIDGDAVETILPISVPVDLPEGPWGVAVVAEKLTEDKMKVLSTSVSGVIFPEVKQAISLELPESDQVEVTEGEGGQVSFAGKVTRHHGFVGPLVVTMTGFPESTLIPEVELAADQTEFELSFEIAAEAKPEQFQNVRMVVQAWDEEGYQIAEGPSQKVKIILLPKEPSSEEESK